ncbi:hypothetical protein HID58_013322 [Brassica napus]|uniref:UBC core domain-containing protein n=1 Tax=Brassica napus TaxID=3708 RepID=A0ABQ8E6B3_BRANA|nr:hypothetical protein HID58_013322 [Brassica napus]
MEETKTEAKTKAVTGGRDKDAKKAPELHEDKDGDNCEELWQIDHTTIKLEKISRSPSLALNLRLQIETITLEKISRSPSLALVYRRNLRFFWTTMDHDAGTDSVASEAKSDPNVVTNSLHTDKSEDLAATNDHHPNVYKDDIVKSNKTGGIGIAINRGGSTDPGNYQCRVRWMNGDIEKVQDAKAVTVADRRFSLGGYVFSASEPTGQVGLVADLNISVDLLARDGTIHKDISTKMLKRVRDFAVGDYVVHVTVPSLGRVDEARENVIVKFDDGSTRAFREVDPSRLEPIPENNFGVLWTDSSVPLVEWQSPSVLTLLSSLIHTNFKVGDWCGTKDGSLGEALLIVHSRTRVDVAWQDGSVECRREATTLIPTETPVDDVFVAEQYVMEKAIVDDGNTTEPKRVGVVKSLDAKERIAIVRWLKPLQRAEEPCQFESEETASVYELERHPDHDYYTYGDVVVRLSPTEQGNDTKHLQQDEVNAGLSWFGNITGLKDGGFEVTWADGIVSKVGPGAVYVVEPDSDDGEPDAAGSGASSASSWGTVDDDDSGAHEIPKEVCSVEKVLPIFFCLTQSTMFNRETLDPSGEKDDPSTQSFGATANPQSEGSVLENKALEGSKSGISDEPVTFKGDSYIFRRFDISQESLDHHYVSEEEQKIKEKVWVKKVHGDWKILQDNLPDGIFVRVYEDRMDLLRAVIVGSYGTPYQDGLFLFDVFLPPKYPSEPPVVFYHSGGWKLNPNLDEDGNVCLSLLNTWKGRGSEVWDPQSSTILQVLVSIQGLVLNAKPYFNEADYDKLIGTVEGERRSLEYNEDAFLLNCKTMMHLMKKQPKGFEELVKEHFIKRGSHILKACNAYMEGYLIGSLTKDALIVDEPVFANSTSAGFRLSLEKLTAKLFPALSLLGASDQ